MKSTLHVCLPIVACLLLVVSPAGAQQPVDPQIQRVFADWEKRRDAIQRIRYTVVGQSIIPKGSTTDNFGRPVSPPNPPEDVPQRQDSMLLIDQPAKRFRLEMTGQNYNRTKLQLYPWVLTTTFDGKSFATAAPREGNTSSVYAPGPSDPDVSIHRNYTRYHPLDTVNAYYLSPLLLAHGLVPSFLNLADFDRRPDPFDFTVQGRHVYGGRQCLVLRTFPDRSGPLASYDEYWLDPARDSAVVRQSAYVNDKLVVDIDITYQQTPHGWLPLRWTGTTRQGDQLLNVTRLRVQEYVVGPPVEDAAFQPDIKPGMIILETTYEDPEKVQNKPAGYRFPTKTYHVGPEGRWNEVVNGVEQHSHAWLWYALSALLATLAVAVLGFCYVHRRRRQQGLAAGAGA